MLGLVLLLGLAAAARADATPPASGHVGNSVCRTCHPDVWRNFYKNPHYKSIAAGNLPAEKTGCEGCHGPGKAHVEARGGRSTIPRAFSLMQPGAIVDACLACHAKDLSRANIRRSSHTEADVVCSSCHSIHTSPTPKFLLVRKQTDLCFGCHASARAQFSMPFKHRVNEGFIQCSDCHNPHGTFAPTWRMSGRPRLADQALGNEEACLKCHSDKRGPFVFEHPPVRLEGCESCHSPHGSMNAKLLRRSALFTVCLECHNGAGSFGRQGDGIRTQSPSHNMADPRYQNCTVCHVRIHGSNAHQLFFR